MKKLLPLLALIILFAWGCGNCEKKEETEKTTQKKVVARVNGRPIYEEDIKGKMSVEDTIDNEILYEEGLKRDVNKRFEKLKIDENRKRTLVISGLKIEIMNSLPVEVSDKEIEDYYQKNKSKYTLPHIKGITLGDKNLAEEIQKRALTGEDFDKIASDYSNSGTNITVMDFGFNNNYDNHFSGKGIGSVSDVIQLINQFRILKIIELKETPFSEVKETIRNTILNEKKEEAFREFVEKLKKENKVEIVEEKK